MSPTCALSFAGVASIGSPVVVVRELRALRTGLAELRSASPADDSAAGRVERGERLVRLRALRVVAVHGHEADDPPAVDHEHGRSRQDPAALTVELVQVGAAGLVKLVRGDVVLEA